MKFLRVALVVMCGFLTGLVHMQAVEITLRDSVTIEGDLLTLADVADIAASADELRQLNTLPIRRILDLSQYTIGHNEVQRIVRRHFRDATVRPGSVAVRRASEQLSAADLNQYAIEHLRARAEDRQIEVRCGVRLSRKPLPSIQLIHQRPRRALNQRLVGGCALPFAHYAGRA